MLMWWRFGCSCVPCSERWHFPPSIPSVRGVALLSTLLLPVPPGSSVLLASLPGGPDSGLFPHVHGPPSHRGMGMWGSRHLCHVLCGQVLWLCCSEWGVGGPKSGVSQRLVGWGPRTHFCGCLVTWGPGHPCCWKAGWFLCHLQLLLGVLGLPAPWPQLENRVAASSSAPHSVLPPLRHPVHPPFPEPWCGG